VSCRAEPRGLISTVRSPRRAEGCGQPVASRDALWDKFFMERPTTQAGFSRAFTNLGDTQVKLS
jgi:hypothetical protein